MVRYFSIVLFVVFCSVAGLTVVATLFPGLVADGQNNKPLIMGIFPRRHQTTTLEMFDPLKNYLAKRLNRSVLLITSPNFKVFWDRVKNRKFDIVHYNQYHYMLSKGLGYEVMAMNEENGKATVTGSVVVRKDSGIESIQDLRGRRILFGGGPQAMQSYIYSTYLLKQAGLTEEDYEVEFTSDAQSALVNTYLKLNNVSAVGIGDVVLDMPFVTKQIDTKELKILSKGERLAHYPWAIKTELSTDLKINIQQILMQMDQTARGKRTLNKAQLTRIVKAVDTDFDAHRYIVREVLGEIY